MCEKAEESVSHVLLECGKSATMSIKYNKIGLERRSIGKYVENMGKKGKKNVMSTSWR